MRPKLASAHAAVFPLYDDGDDVGSDHALWAEGYCIDTEDGYRADPNISLVDIEPAIWERVAKDYQSICASMEWLWRKPTRDPRGRRLEDGSLLVILYADIGPLALYTVKDGRIAFQA